MSDIIVILVFVFAIVGVPVLLLCAKMDKVEFDAHHPNWGNGQHKTIGQIEDEFNAKQK